MAHKAPAHKRAAQRRRARIRKRIRGSAERPRLTVYRSNKHIYAQVVDDDSSRALASVSDQDAKLKAAAEKAESKVDRAKLVGQRIAEICLERGIKQVIFDRNGYLYHGRVSALADGAREGGLDF